jgi:type II secretory pathway component GspD/PulD (secretin)
MYFRSFLIFCLLTGSPLLAQEKAAEISRNEEAMSSFQAVNASIDTILQEYEQLTGNVLIKDSSLAANALPISISVPKPVPRSELVRIIESVLLLNNFALIPGPERKTVKVINMNSGKNPRSEALPLYASPALLLGLAEGRTAFATPRETTGSSRQIRPRNVLGNVHLCDHYRKPAQVRSAGSMR